MPKKERAHLFIACPKNNQSLKENWLLIFQNSSFKIYSNRKLPNFGLFLDKQVCRSQTPKMCANIIADSETFKRYRNFDTLVGRWSNWNGGIIIFSHSFLTNVVITGSLSYTIIFSAFHFFKKFFELLFQSLLKGKLSHFWPVWDFDYKTVFPEF